jgi:HlyD family secretion protein
MITDMLPPIRTEHELCTPKRRKLRVAATIVIVSGLCWALVAGFRIVPEWSSSRRVVATARVDRGDIDQVVTENGSVESSDDDVVRCQVESFLALPDAGAAGKSERRPSPTKSRVVTATAPGSAAVSTAAGTIAAASSARSKSKSGGEAGGVAASLAATATAPPDTPLTAGLGTANDASSQAAAAEKAKAPKRPEIRSFGHTVAPHIPLRSTFSDQGVIAIKAPAPPTILSILPEGTQVSARDVVCELDSSAFRQALEFQKLRYLRAKAWVEQAGYILEANEIALREYKDGILPQDIQLIRNYIGICETDRDRTVRNLTWARAAFAKGFRTEGQVEADAARVELAEITLRDARGMLRRLVNYTGKRILKAHKAKVEGIRADRLSLDSSLRLERERLERIQAMIAHCTMRAPHDGIVVYANRVNGWGTVETQIREGMRVYQSQPIFRLLDSRRMHIQARINESQVARVRSGQPVLIHLDAFPDRILKGSVAEIMPLPSFAKGPFSDVHTFLANVRIESGGFAALRSGLTAELKFLVETRRRVPRVPLEAIRWFGEQTFAALVVSTATGLHCLWQPIELGVSDTTFAEVVSGLEPGDRVVAHAENLPPDGAGPPDPEIMMDLALEEE